MDMNDEMGGQPEEKGYCIKIAVSPDGSMQVGTEEMDDDYEGMQPARSAKQVMQMVMGIIEKGGKMPSPDDDAEFNAGFGKPEKAPMIEKMRPDEEEMT